MSKCEEPGCNARTMHHKKCEHHRARNNRKPALTPEARTRKNELDRQRKLKRAAAAGLLSGWETSY